MFVQTVWRGCSIWHPLLEQSDITLSACARIRSKHFFSGIRIPSSPAEQFSIYASKCYVSQVSDGESVKTALLCTVVLELTAGKASLWGSEGDLTPKTTDKGIRDNSREYEECSKTEINGNRTRDRDLPSGLPHRDENRVWPVLAARTPTKHLAEEGWQGISTLSETRGKLDKRALLYWPDFVSQYVLMTSKD